jgi:hypothetical protein
MTNAEIEQRIEDQAYDSAEGAVGAAGDAEEALGDVIAEARELRRKITSGLRDRHRSRRELPRPRRPSGSGHIVPSAMQP